MRCFFCGEEIVDREKECFNCDRPIGSGCYAKEEKVAGDIRGVFCKYCVEIRDSNVVPIRMENLKRWTFVIKRNIKFLSSEDIKNAFLQIAEDMEKLIWEPDIEY
ncbi:MAG: hypothetical protein GF353_16880 [Candidatus Lokiarchaeota archaeon]|nr:hypothetical protein [Candidatus Lokiarchaeota archaeon]